LVKGAPDEVHRFSREDTTRAAVLINNFFQSSFEDYDIRP